MQNRLNHRILDSSADANAASFEFRTIASSDELSAEEQERMRAQRLHMHHQLMADYII